MYIHDDLKLIYLANPRTGSVTTTDMLLEVGFHGVSPLAHSPRQTHHERLYGPNSPIYEMERDQWTVITTVRNHWDCVVSWMPGPPEKPYWRPEDLEHRLNDPRYISQDRMFMHLPDADIVWRFETLEPNINETLSKYGLVVPKLSTVNESQWRTDREYRKYYTPRSRDYIHNRFKAEIDQLGYTF